MQQSTSQQLYAYWDRVRNGRLAPCRFEIEPAAIAPLLAETFIAECTGPLRYRFRLAGTRICEQFGHELRGIELVSLWRDEDRDSIIDLLARVFGEGAVGHVLSELTTPSGRSCEIDLIMMPLVLSGDVVNRALGAITVQRPPFWLGTEPVLPLSLLDAELDEPNRDRTHPHSSVERTVPGKELENLLKHQFKLHEGGLSQVEDQ
jgi:hypothetical protein